MGLNVLFTAPSEYQVCHVLHYCFLFLLACLVQLSVPFVNVVLDLCKLLNRPLTHINECLDLISGISVQPGYGGLQALAELPVVTGDKLQNVQSGGQSGEHLLPERAWDRCLGDERVFDRACSAATEEDLGFGLEVLEEELQEGDPRLELPEAAISHEEVEDLHDLGLD